jgi:hypothetical protein
MKLEQTIRARQRLLSNLPVTGEILRGSLLQRTIRSHGPKCAKCASGEGHTVSVLTISYAHGRTRQFSLKRELVPEVQRWLDNYNGCSPSTTIARQANALLFFTFFDP